MTAPSAPPDGHDVLADFFATCRSVIGKTETPADIVSALAPAMQKLVTGRTDFLQPAHYRDDPAHYARNLIHASEEGDLSLYALVWLPGQWTPVHDHGTWGVVGVLQGVLYEQSYMRIDDNAHHAGNDGISLVPGGLVLLAHGAVSTFVPNPDHIHMTGVRAEDETVVSLHLYGRAMDSFHIYDIPAGTRKLINVAHNES